MTTATDNESFVWREMSDGAVRIENPLLRQPISFIIDDPTPGYNPAYFHSGFRFGPPTVPRELIDRFADLIETSGMRGKFSVIPCPFGMGRIDQKIDGISDADVRYFIDVVRERIAPYLDVTPEALTHWNALDLTTGQLLPYWEHVWSRMQDRTTLTPYLVRALEIMNAVGLPSAGVTSPWDFGDGVENEYAEAVLAAQKQVNGLSFSWYFLQMDYTSRHVPPQVTVLRPDAKEAVVGIVACDPYDFGREVWRGGEPNPDMLITVDGQGGRLAAVLAAGGPAAFHSHWQTMFSMGKESGLRDLAEVARRIEEHFGDKIAWTGCADLATYAAASAAVGVTMTDGVTAEGGFTTDAPFGVDHFTMSLPSTRPVRAVRIDGHPLTQSLNRRAMTEDSYLVADDRIYLCWKLAGRQKVAIELA